MLETDVVGLQITGGSVVGRSFPHNDANNPSAATHAVGRWNNTKHTSISDVVRKGGKKIDEGEGDN